MSITDEPALLEEALTAAAPPPPSTWQPAADRLSAAAAEEGLVDVAVARHDSPLGPLLLAATAEGLVRVGLPSEDEDAVLDELARRISVRVVRAPRSVLTLTRAQLEGYFDGGLRAFAVPLDWRLTAGFRRAVLHATARIPYGETATYRQVATEAGSAGAVRAAGTALAVNPLPIVVPCHRVLRSGGELGSYRGGAAAKALLLDLEGARR